MLAVLTKAIAVASGGLLSIGSILIVLLLLSSVGGLKKALSYYAGYFGGYLTIGFVGLMVSEALLSDASAGGGDSQSMVTPIISLIMGTLMLTFGFRKWRSPKEESPEPPKLFAKLDSMSAPKIMAFGAAITFINFKNLAIYLSAVSIVLEGGLAFQQQAVSIVAVAFVFCLGVISPILLFLAIAERAMPLLQSFKAYLERNNRTLAITAFSLFGTIFFSRGVMGLLAFV